MRRTVVLLAALVALSGCSEKAEQQAHARRMDLRGDEGAILDTQDREFLERAAEGSNAEIAMGRLVETRAASQAVREYGRMMVRDHSALQRQLLAIAVRKGVALPRSLGEQQAGYDRVVDLRKHAFDQEFLQVMNEDHDQARELFRAQATGGHDRELRQFAASALPLIERHLTHAKAMADGISPTP
jgi:putative membrane protein